MDRSVKAALELDGDYELGDVLGTGGMGVIYTAIQRSLGRAVAIKIPHPHLANDPSVSRRFRTEARASGQLDHRNIGRVIDFGGPEGALFLVMQHVAGVPLDKLVMEHGPMEMGTAANICGQILAGLEAAHTAGIIHADIKTGNVLVETMPDGTLRAVVIDFGLARFSSEPATDDGRLVAGTPDYIAPELVRGCSPTAASDIYAVGIVLYELLTGTTPFGGGTSNEILARQLADAVIPPSLRHPEGDIPPSLESIVMQALAKEPSRRFASAAEFAVALHAATAVLVVRPRLARGTNTPGFSAQTTTRNWQLGHMRVPMQPAAAGEDTSTLRTRAMVKTAIASGDSDSIVTSYLELVRVLVEGRQLESAAAELERGLMILRPGLSEKANPPALWRLQLCLAALYSGLGHPTQARRAALLGQADAHRAGSTLGVDRARELLLRLT